MYISILYPPEWECQGWICNKWHRTVSSVSEILLVVNINSWQLNPGGFLYERAENRYFSCSEFTVFCFFLQCWPVKAVKMCLDMAALAGPWCEWTGRKNRNIGSCNESSLHLGYAWGKAEVMYCSWKQETWEHQPNPGVLQAIPGHASQF